MYDFEAAARTGNSYLRRLAKPATHYTSDLHPAYRSNGTYRDELAAEPSFYADLVARDFQPWKGEGISEDLVDAAAIIADVCDAPLARVQIINGTLWVKRIAAPDGAGERGYWGRAWALLQRTGLWC